MKIAIDVMGGDFAPRELVLGAKQYLDEAGPAGLILVGRESDIRETLPDLPASCEISHTADFVEMGETPTTALRRKKNASVAVAARLVKEGKAAAFLSAGSTGAQMAASLLEIGRIPGVERPPISVLLPTAAEHGVLVCDVGANVDCRPFHLLQFALMGSAYYEAICRIPAPKVGLLNVGSEPGKGNDLTKAAYDLLAKAPLNFVGNIEPDHMFAGEAHVVVADGFVGNILLKTSEGVAEMIMNPLKKAIAGAGLPPEIAGRLATQLRRYQPDAPEYSGAPLLGIAGGAIVCHGKSKARVIAHALQLATEYAKTDVIGTITRRVAQVAGPQAQGDAR
ncbi:MAG: phosphate acyltransferase PlsX [Candidatus Riflebacteria bacterium]|nr:phosphate acyltransferase PlsX [Candidatus Riflebacteria bacterium]